MSGWIKLHRSLQKWEWYSSPNCLQVFVHLLLHANYEDGTYRGVFIPRGSLTTSRSKIAQKTGLTESQIRTVLNKLISTGEITMPKMKTFTMISITNWGSYQVDRQQIDQEIAQGIASKIAADSATSKNIRNKKKEDNKELLIEILKSFNKILNSKYKPTSKNLKLINARLREGFTAEDIAKVITFKKSDWEGTSFAKHLAPSTLLGPRFDEYLAQSEIALKPKSDALFDFLNKAEVKLNGAPS